MPAPLEQWSSRLAALPSKSEILDFIKSAPGKVGKREIARAFKIKGGGRIALKRIMRELSEEGLIDRGRRDVKKVGGLPAVSVLEIIDQDVDGELMAKPVSWDENTPPPKIILAPGGGGAGKKRYGRPMGGPTPGIGNRVLARLSWGQDETVEARLIKVLGDSSHHVLGVYRNGPGKGEGRVQPVERKSRYEMVVSSSDTAGAKPGDLVKVEPVGHQSHGLRRVRVLEVLGGITDQRSVSLIAIHRHGIPTGFTVPEEAQANSAQQVTLGARTDLRRLPLVTIDPVDARDFDDAVHACSDDDPKNKGGWIVVVAIADVSHYVTPGSPLDLGAQKKGNSVYFPDRVVPMLPEKLSNDLCSLKQGVDRPCLAVRMVFDASGIKLRHTFLRGLMNSHARLTYGQAQAAIDGEPDETTEPLLVSVLKPLYAAYHALSLARDKREPLDLDLPEHKIELAEDGTVQSIGFRDRLDAHRLVEEFMIQANVAAAEELERKKTPLIYRTHDAPSMEKIESLQDFLRSLDLPFSQSGVLKPQHFNGLLRKVKSSANEAMVNEVVLRSQAQAVYSRESLGHFGLNLRRYAHFTSPIRRYADLIVHRALIRACKLGKDGLTDKEIESLEPLAEQISLHERRAMAAERDSNDRYVAAFLADRVGAVFKGRIAGVTRFGLFIRLNETGADGIVPMRSLNDDYYVHNEKIHALIGERHGGTYRLGTQVDVRLEEATPLTGGLRFELLTAAEQGLSKKAPKKHPSRGGTSAKRKPGTRKRRR